MRLHNQMKEYVNSMADVVSSLEISTGDPDAVARIEAAIAEIQSFLDVSPYVTFLEDEE